MPDLRVRGLADGYNNKFVTPAIDPVTGNRLTSTPTIDAGKADIRLMYDCAGALQTPTNNITYLNENFVITLSQSEMQHRNIAVLIFDASSRASPEFADTEVIVHTIAHTLALHHGAAGA